MDLNQPRVLDFAGDGGKVQRQRGKWRPSNLHRGLDSIGDHPGKQQSGSRGGVKAANGDDTATPSPPDGQSVVQRRLSDLPPHPQQRANSHPQPPTLPPTASRCGHPVTPTDEEGGVSGRPSVLPPPSSDVLPAAATVATPWRPWQ